MRILLLSAYHTASHRHWCEGLMAALPSDKDQAFDWTLLSLPDRFFRWRIRGNPLSWIDEPALAGDQHYDLLIATSMVDLATLKGIKPHLATVPSILYFHENQFAYPVSSNPKQAQHSSIDPQMVNLYSALAADKLLFNSRWNRDSFLQGVDDLLAKLPDSVPANIAADLAKYSVVLAVPIAEDFAPCPKASRSLVDRGACGERGNPIELVWAARWEYDKGPDRLLAALRQLERSAEIDQHMDYRITILGQRFRKAPEAFATIEAEFGHRLRHFGYLPDRAAYLSCLQRADIFISTAIHEFQGLSAMEAVAAGCTPLVPDRLSYPELFGQQNCYPSFLANEGGGIDAEAAALVAKLSELIAGAGVASDAVSPSALGGSMDAYRWSQLKSDYRQCLLQVADAGG